MDVDCKADASPVTIADQQAEEVMRALIKQAFPEHGIFGEEHGLSLGSGVGERYMWVLDPIDGTKSFITGGRGLWSGAQGRACGAQGCGGGARGAGVWSCGALLAAGRRPEGLGLGAACALRAAADPPPALLQASRCLAR